MSAGRLPKKIRELLEHLTSWVLRNGAGNRDQVGAAISRLMTMTGDRVERV